METIYETKTIKVGLRISENVEKVTVRDPESVVGYIKGIYADLDADQEHFTILCLNKANVVTGFKVVFSGGQDEAVVDPKIVFRNALLMGATAIIVVHNHPSGRTEPSAEDRAITKKLDECGKMLGVRILDHIILGNGSFSFREGGLL